MPEEGMSGDRKCQAAVDDGSGLSILREPGLANSHLFLSNGLSKKDLPLYLCEDDDQAGPCCFNPTKNLVFRPSIPPIAPLAIAAQIPQDIR